MTTKISTGQIVGLYWPSRQKKKTLGDGCKLKTTEQHSVREDMWNCETHHTTPTSI